MTTKPKIVFMGTPEFARVILEKLYEEQYPIVGVWAQPDRPVGRGRKLQSPPVAEFAKQKHLKLFQPKTLKDENNFQDLALLKPDYIVVAAYGKILSERVLNVPQKECLNVHASLLPKYRGAAPIQYAVMNDDPKTGVAIMRMVKELDAGPVFLMKDVNISAEDTTATLMKTLAELGATALIETLQKLEEDFFEPTEQNSNQVTLAPKISKEMAQINWQDSARKIDCQIRALLPWPVCETSYQEQRVRIYKAKALDSHAQKTPGEILDFVQDGVMVATGQNDLLMQECQLAGKKRMPALEMARGLHIKVGDRFV